MFGKSQKDPVKKGGGKMLVLVIFVVVFLGICRWGGRWWVRFSRFYSWGDEVGMNEAFSLSNEVSFSVRFIRYVNAMCMSFFFSLFRSIKGRWDCLWGLSSRRQGGWMDEIALIRSSLVCLVGCI